MSASTPDRIPHMMRRTYIIDKPLQLGVVLAIQVALSIVAFATIAGVYFLPDKNFFATLTGTQVRDLVIRLTTVYFMFCLAALGALAILITHRIAGPIRVIETAVAAMRRGDFGKRLTLRKHDYLKGLAQSLREFREAVMGERLKRAELLARLRTSLDQVDMAQAHEALEELDSLEASLGATRAEAPVVAS